MRLIVFLIFLLLISFPSPSSFHRCCTAKHISCVDIEAFVSKIEELFWDRDYGGYYCEISEGVIRNNNKCLSSHIFAILCYTELYENTSNTSYLKKAVSLISFVQEKFVSNITGTYYMVMNRNFSQPNLFSGTAEINGQGSIHWSIFYGISLLYFAEKTGNETAIHIAEKIASNLIRYMWDREFGGLLGLADIYVPVKSPASNGLFSYFLYKLNVLTHNETYMDYFWKSIGALDKMWDNGFHHAYTQNFTILNSNRYTSYLMVDGAMAYLIAYNLSGNESYLEKGVTLINQTLYYHWDAFYGGYIYSLTEDFNIFDDIKRTYIQLETLLAYDLLASISKVYSEILTRRIKGLLRILSDRVRTQMGLVKEADRYWHVLYYIFRSDDQFAYAYLLLKYGVLMEDENPPVLREIETVSEGRTVEIIIRAVDIEDGLARVSVSYNSGMVLLKYDEKQNLFVGRIPGDVKVVEILATDNYNNTASIVVEIRLALIEPNYDIQALLIIGIVVVEAILFMIIFIIRREKKAK